MYILCRHIQTEWGCFIDTSLTAQYTPSFINCQVNFIYIAQYHKSQNLPQGASQAVQHMTPSVFRPSKNCQRRLSEMLFDSSLPCFNIHGQRENRHWQNNRTSRSQKTCSEKASTTPWRLANSIVTAVPQQIPLAFLIFPIPFCFQCSPVCLPLSFSPCLCLCVWCGCGAPPPQSPSSWLLINLPAHLPPISSSALQYFQPRLFTYSEPDLTTMDRLTSAWLLASLLLSSPPHLHSPVLYNKPS